MKALKRRNSQASEPYCWRTPRPNPITSSNVSFQPRFWQLRRAIWPTWLSLTAEWRINIIP
jgi:hypothetical protein